MHGSAGHFGSSLNHLVFPSQPDPNVTCCLQTSLDGRHHGTDGRIHLIRATHSCSSYSAPLST